MKCRKSTLHLGARLKKLRKQNDLTVNNLRDLLNEYDYPVCIQTIYKWESDTIIPEIKVLNLLASIYSVTVGSLFEDRVSCLALTDSELEFITLYRNNKSYNKAINLLIKKEKEKVKHGNKIIF